MATKPPTRFLCWEARYISWRWTRVFECQVAFRNFGDLDLRKKNWCFWKKHGGFHSHGGTPKRIVVTGKSHENGWFGGTPLSGPPDDGSSPSDATALSALALLETCDNMKLHRCLLRQTTAASCTCSKIWNTWKSQVDLLVPWFTSCFNGHQASRSLQNPPSNHQRSHSPDAFSRMPGKSVLGILVKRRYCSM